MSQPMPSLPRRRRMITSGINVAPLLDAILNLVFFFLMATTLRDRNVSMEVSLPSAASAKVTQKDEKPVITLDVAGKIFLNGEERAIDALKADMQALLQKEIKDVSIHADKGVDFGRVVEVMDVCKLAGIHAVTIEAEKKNNF